MSPVSSLVSWMVGASLVLAPAALITAVIVQFIKDINKKADNK